MVVDLVLRKVEMLDSTMDFVTADMKVENLVDGWADQMD